MTTYDEAMTIMQERFSKDSLMAIATTDGNKIFNRIIDAYYENGSFYITCYKHSNKMKQIETNPEVAIAAIDWFTGSGIGKNLGCITDPKNAKIRNTLKEAFKEWYDKGVDEVNGNTCILEIKLTEGMLIKDHNAIRYKIDFTKSSAKISKNFEDFK